MLILSKFVESYGTFGNYGKTIIGASTRDKEERQDTGSDSYTMLKMLKFYEKEERC